MLTIIVVVCIVLMAALARFKGKRVHTYPLTQQTNHYNIHNVIYGGMLFSTKKSLVYMKPTINSEENFLTELTALEEQNTKMSNICHTDGFHNPVYRGKCCDEIYI